MNAFYNDNDPKVCAWLRELQRADLITGGTVDDRSILDLRGADLAGFRRVHFFAGIGGWDYALRLAGWPEDREVWTGSCPCQPFSSAGRAQGVLDERHLWPAFLRLITERRPATVFGEQVASRAGREWLAGVRADLEALGYAFGAADLCAASVGAPHIRQRLFWVGHADGARSSGRMLRPVTADTRSQWNLGETGSSERIECGDGKIRRIEPGLAPLAHGTAARVVRLRGYGNAIVPQVAAQFIRAFLDC